jgi:prepilin-type processing-associated H-X9-DG protein
MFQLSARPEPADPIVGTDQYTIGTTYWPVSCNACYPQAWHVASINVALVDGHVRQIPLNMTPSVWYSATSPNDGGKELLPPE